MIRLSVAQLCPDCDVIYEEQACPVCGTENGIWIAKVLGRVTMQHGCWSWAGRLTGRGYGHVVRKRRLFAAHRILYKIFRGPIQKDLTIDHLCRNRACVNPWHMEPVSAAVNTQRGLLAKLSPAQVLQIRESKTPNVQIAKEYGVDRQTIWQIRTRLTWRNL